MEKNNRILLICLYNPKSLGTRYLEHALEEAGFEVWVLAFKKYRVFPVRPTDTEIQHLLSLIDKHDPLLIGFSLLSSFYLEVVIDICAKIKSKTPVPLVWGGTFPTLSPDRCLRHCDYVMRGESEGAIVELAEKLRDGKSVYDVENLTFIKDGETVTNPLRMLVQDIDNLVMAQLGKQNKYYIESNKLLNIDVNQSSHNYETSCSRGCPFACSYCTSNGLRQLYKGSRYVRFRSVPNLIKELRDAKERMRNLSTVYFYDEVFSSDLGWIDEFCESYKAEIDLPFGIWAHPSMTNYDLISRLRKAGLFFVALGVQSGSKTVRKEIFHRAGSNEQILSAAKALVDTNVPLVKYEFIVHHPYENVDELKETYELCAQLPGRFTLRLLDLHYLPGAAISEKVVKDGFFSDEEMEKIMYAPIEEHYQIWWAKRTRNEEADFWIHLIFLTQFQFIKSKVKRLAEQGVCKKNSRKAKRYYKLCNILDRMWHLRQKGLAFLRGKTKLPV